MFRHLGAVCLEIQYEINHTNLLLDNIASASFFIEFDTEKSADIKSKQTNIFWHNIIQQMQTVQMIRGCAYYIPFHRY